MWSATGSASTGRLGNRQQLLQFAGEVEDAVVLGVIEGAHAERIADERQTLPRAVPPGGGECAVERIQSCRSRNQPAAQRRGGGVHRWRERAGARHQVVSLAVNPRRLFPDAHPTSDSRATPRAPRPPRDGPRDTRWRQASLPRPEGRPGPRSHRFRSRQELPQHKPRAAQDALVPRGAAPATRPLAPPGRTAAGNVSATCACKPSASETCCGAPHGRRGPPIRSSIPGGPRAGRRAGRRGRRSRAVRRGLFQRRPYPPRPQEPRGRPTPTSSRAVLRVH